MVSRGLSCNLHKHSPLRMYVLIYLIVPLYVYLYIESVQWFFVPIRVRVVRSGPVCPQTIFSPKNLNKFGLELTGLSRQVTVENEL